MCLDQHTLVYVLQLCVSNACDCTSGWILSRARIKGWLDFWVAIAKLIYLLKSRSKTNIFFIKPCVKTTVVRLECIDCTSGWITGPKLFSFNNKFFILIDMNFLQNFLNFDWYRYVSRPAYTCVCATVVRLECMWLYKWLDIICFFPSPKLFSFNNKFFILIDMNFLQNFLNFDWYRYVSRPAYTCVCATVVRLECMWLYKWLDIIQGPN